MANPFIPAPPPMFRPDMANLQAPAPTGPAPDRVGFRGFPHWDGLMPPAPAAAPAPAPKVLPQSLPNLDAYIANGGAAAVPVNAAPRPWAPAKEFPVATEPPAKKAVAAIAPPANPYAGIANSIRQHAPGTAASLDGSVTYSPGALAHMLGNVPNWGPGQQAQAMALALLGFGDNTPQGQMRAQALQVAGGAYNPAIMQSGMLQGFMRQQGY